MDPPRADGGSTVRRCLARDGAASLDWWPRSFRRGALCDRRRDCSSGRPVFRADTRAQAAGESDFRVRLRNAGGISRWL